MNRKKLAGIIVGCTVILIVVIVAVRGQTVIFADPNLEAVVREYIGKAEGPICASDLEGLTSLGVVGGVVGINITDLTGLEHCTALTDLELVDQRIDDITPLSHLTNLSYLDLSGSQVDDISALSHLTRLTELWLGDNQISDISPLAKLINLERLNLNGNHVDDVSALSHLTNLGYLYLADDEISDITPLSNLVNLGNSHIRFIPPSEDLDLSNNRISDICPLSNLTSLEWVILDDNNIGDITPLANLTNLTKLSLSDNQIRDISPLASLTNLVMLHLANNQVDDISSLSNLVGLGTQEWEMMSPRSLHLDLGGNQIADISLLSNLTGVKRLSLSDNQISDISPLANLTGLNTVYVWGNPLSSDSINIYVPDLRARGVDVGLTSQNREPIEIVSVLGPIGLPNPAGPIVEMTLRNVGVEPVVSLTATLEVSSASGIPFDFTFDDVSPSNPLQPDGSISNTRCLIGGGFNSNEWYSLKIHATLEDGAEFVYAKRVQIKAPG